ncbi:OsmC family protein [Nonomuraea candida]|uniref:OsmC family protein n=1 Tax=Nonomuraea candida TaxID=359159 RepID=UPI000A544D0C|nr:OsmC family protein [Nonomuraea candida]
MLTKGPPASPPRCGSWPPASRSTSPTRAVTAEVGLSPNGKGGFQLDATLRVELPDGIAPEVARELVEATHQVCPYSNATRGDIPVELVVE